MQSARGRIPVAGRSPPALLSLVLLLEPRVERREVFDERRRVRFRFSRELRECLWPRLALAEREHRAELRACALVAVDAAGIERPLVARRLAERTMKLELVDPREEVP